MSTYPQIIEFLRMERLRRRIKQGHLAKISGIDPNTISRIENFRDAKRGGKELNSTVYFNTIELWARALGYEFELKLISKEKPNEQGRR